jgi:hypothetical protein
MPTSYTQLLTLIPSLAWDDSAELATILPSLISIAETRVSRDLQVSQFDAPSITTALVSGQSDYALPTDIAVIKSIAVYNGGTRVSTLVYKTLEYLDEYWPVLATTTLTPRYYATLGPAAANTSGSPLLLRISGTPGAGLTYELRYTRQLPSLSGSNQTNWLTDSAEDVLIEAIMVEVMKWKVDRERLADRERAYAQAVTRVNGEEAAFRRDDNNVIGIDANNPPIRTQ